MTPSVFRPHAASSDAAFSCAVRATAVVEVDLADLPALRDAPGTPPSGPLPNRFLRYSDEQTVVGLAAVIRAMHSPALQGVDFSDWGVVAAPRFPGRIGAAATLRKFRQDGACSISPHAIPQFSLHSVSGAISVGLGLHGPNFGIGGGREAMAEGLTVAISFADWRTLPGLWLVFTELHPDANPDGQGSSHTPACCRAVAMALTADNGQGDFQLRLTSASGRRANFSVHLHEIESADGCLADLAAWLSALLGRPQPAQWSFALPWGDRVEMVKTAQQQAKAA